MGCSQSCRWNVAGPEVIECIGSWRYDGAALEAVRLRQGRRSPVEVFSVEIDNDGELCFTCEEDEGDPSLPAWVLLRLIEDAKKRGVSGF